MDFCFRRVSCCLFCALLLQVFASPQVSAQDPQALRIGGVMPGGIRSSVTESWGTFRFELTNLSDMDRHARLALFFEGQEQVQYGRNVWIPAQSTLSTWLLVGKPGLDPSDTSCEIQALLYDRSGGKDHVILPTNEERLTSRKFLYKRDLPYTAIMLDEEVIEEPPFGELPQPTTRFDEAIRLARTFRAASTLSESVHLVPSGYLPVIPEAFSGVDQFILASNRIANDPTGMQALRQWLERGGRVWVMLDMVDAETLAPLLGDALDFQVVDRIGLTTTKIETQTANPTGSEPLIQQHDRPVPFVRVMLPPQERVVDTLNGWPAWFTRQVGRGKVLFTTAGARAWSRPRNRNEPSPYENYPDLPVPAEALDRIANELISAPVDDLSRLGAVRTMLGDEIGYSVVRRSVVVLVFGGALLAGLLLGVALRKSRRTELLGWVGPAAALGATVWFVLLGESSRRAVPPTVSVFQVVDAHPGKAEASVRGMLAAYRPDSGLGDVGARQGGLFELDMTGMEGQTRQLVTTDLDAWHWENLSLPAEVRFSSFQSTVSTGEPITAVARFGPEGIEGKLAAGLYRDVDDAILNMPGGRNLAVRLRPDGTFSAAGQDVLPTGQFLTGAVLSDRQQHRQEVYREFLKRSGAGSPEGRNFLLAWAEPIDMQFTLAPEARSIGNALLLIPMKMEHAASGEHVTIPGPLVPYRQIISDRQVRPIMELSYAAEMHLRFQLPPEVLPLKVERARLIAKIKAPARVVTVAGRIDGAPLELARVESPLDPIRIEIKDERLLQQDKEGGLHLTLSIRDPVKGVGSNARTPQNVENWTIEYVELEVSGQTGKDGS